MLLMYGPQHGVYTDTVFFKKSLKLHLVLRPAQWHSFCSSPQHCRVSNLLGDGRLSGAEDGAGLVELVVGGGAGALAECDLLLELGHGIFGALLKGDEDGPCFIGGTGLAEL